MANSTLANLTASGPLTGPELFYSDNGAQDVKVTANQLKAFIVGAGSVSVASGKTLTVSNTLTLAGTDGATLNVGAGGTLGTAAFVNTGTGANAQSLLDLSGTLNTSGSPAAIKLNLTNTASGSTSRFADFQLGGTSKFNFAIGGTTPSTVLNIAGGNFGGMTIINGADAGVTNNFEFLALYFGSNIATIDSNKIGTGTVRNLRINVGQPNMDFNGAAAILGPTVAVPAGGTAGTGYRFSSTANFGIFFGSGAPTLSAAQGSLYIRSDGSATNNRAYINTDGSTTWTAISTAA